MIDYVILTLIGYLIGQISPSYIIAKIKGFNIKEKGSKNCGASNAYLTMGIKIGAIVCVIDIFKVFIASLIALPFFKDISNFHLVVGYSCVLGHMFPFYLKFKGGKGFSCVIACMFLANPIFGTITIIVALAMAFLANYIVVATYICIIATSIFIPIFTNLDLMPTIYCLLAVSIIFVKHIPNIIKIIKGEEFPFIKKKKAIIETQEND